jgi:16S rRNA (guanine527-N7)-methyltransferase
LSLAILARRAAELGAPLDSEQLAAFELYRDELLRWNRRVNLTSVIDPAAVEVRHFVDSISCLIALRDLLAEKPAASLVDVGSGAGLPGLPLKIAAPSLRLTLIDSTSKKTTFLQHLVSCLGLGGVAVLTGRAEELAHRPALREQYDVALGRALAPLPALLELCLPFVRVGGRLVANRRGDLAAQQAEAEPAARTLGGSFGAPIPVDLGPGLCGYGLVVADKIRPTPERYPRRPGVPAKRPILATGPSP